MKLLKTLTLLLISNVLALSYPATASPQEDIKKVEKYLNALDTAQSKFTQISPDGDRTTGTFYLNRPGRLRFEYDAPVDDFVVADGTFIYFYDAAVQEQSNAPIGQTLADFILRPDISLSGDIRVKDIKRAAGLLQLTLIQNADPEAGSISLGFTETPLQLKKWRVVDARGAITEISLRDMKVGIELSDNLFYYRDPNRLAPGLNQ